MKYWPLLSLILIAALGATATTQFDDMTEWMHFFMGFSLCQFAMLKIFNPSGFTEGFQKYDLIAKNFRSYGLIYPWIELGLGLGYLAFFNPLRVYSITIIVFSVGTVGVISALRKGLDLRCACMGTVLNVPLSTVTLTEDLVMVLMALLLLLNL